MSMEKDSISKEEFRDILIERLKETYTEDQFEIEKVEINKNNGVKLHGIKVNEKGKRVAPTVYIDEAYEAYINDDASLQEIIVSFNRGIDNGFENMPEEVQSSGDVFENYDFVKERSFVRIVGIENNDEYLEGLVKRDFLNMAIIPYILLGDEEEPCASHACVVVREEHLKHWNVDKDEYIDLAINNTARNLCYKPMLDILIKMMGNRNPELIEELEEERENGFSSNMFVISTKNMFYGASAMIFSEFLDECMKKEAYDKMVIIPSSVHEIIAIMFDDDTISPDDMRQMISEVNHTSVEATEVLSYTPYYKELGKAIKYYNEF